MIHARSYTGTTGLLKPSGPLIDENVVIRKLIFRFVFLWRVHSYYITRKVYVDLTFSPAKVVTKVFIDQLRRPPSFSAWW